MRTSNDLLREARERTPSTTRPGQCLSRAELAQIVTRILYPPECQQVSPFNSNYLGKLKLGTIRFPQDAYRCALRTALDVDSDEELGFHPTDPTTYADNTPILRINMTGTAQAGPGLLALLADTEPELRSGRIGPEHLDLITSTTDLLRTWDTTHGGVGVGRHLADPHLRRLARLLAFRDPDGLNRALHRALADLAQTVGFMLFDAHEHPAARNRFTFALHCANLADDQPLQATILANLARQAIWCGQPDAGLTYAETGLVRADRLGPTHRAMLHTVRARALAHLPDRARAALAAVKTADNTFTLTNPHPNTPTTDHYNQAGHHGETGQALFDITTRSGLPTDAAERLRFAVEHHPPTHQRAKALAATTLAILALLHDDPQQGAQAGTAAVAHAQQVRSMRVRDQLLTLHQHTHRYTGIKAIDTLRQRIESTVGSAAVGTRP